MVVEAGGRGSVSLKVLSVGESNVQRKKERERERECDSFILVSLLYLFVLLMLPIYNRKLKDVRLC